jgi:hypothetical protein
MENITLALFLNSDADRADVVSAETVLAVFKR